MTIMTGRLLVPAALWLALAVTGHALGDPAPLPRIRIDAAGRGFVTADGQPFQPLGVTYYRPRTGWAPQVWTRFDEPALRADFARMKDLGINTVRVFLSWTSFTTPEGSLDPVGLARLDTFLAVAEQHQIYVHPTGPDHWEGVPAWARGDRYVDEQLLTLQEAFWRQLASRYRGRAVIFAYDLLNEPAIGWDTPELRTRWNAWLEQRYATPERLAQAWHDSATPAWGNIPVPPRDGARDDPRIVDYQQFRQELGETWIRRQVAALRAADPEALVTVGLIQWAVPELSAQPWIDAGFPPARVAPHVDFLEGHFYPVCRGIYQYEGPEAEARNLADLNTLVDALARPGKPVVIAEFGWYGGITPTFAPNLRPASEDDQARWCRQVVETTAPRVQGWLNWGLYDSPEATDPSQGTGLLTADGQEKAWGRAFRELARRPQRTSTP